MESRAAQVIRTGTNQPWRDTPILHDPYEIRRPANPNPALCIKCRGTSIGRDPFRTCNYCGTQQTGVALPSNNGHHYENGQSSAERTEIQHEGETGTGHAPRGLRQAAQRAGLL